MAVKNGYKQTEVGVIPEDWGISFIEDVAEITTGGKNTQDRVDDGIYPFFVRSQTVERINSYSFDGEAVLTAGDGVGTGKVFHYINGKFDTHQRVYRMSGFGTRVNGYFFFLYFSNHFYTRIMQMTAKSSVDSVRRDMIARMKIPLPPLAEQEAIAGALSDADAWIESLEQLIAKKRQIKQGAMQELLTGKRRLPGFSGKWETKRLGDHCRFLRNGTNSRAELNVEGSLKYLHYGDIHSCNGVYICPKSLPSLPTSKANTLDRLQDGDLVLADASEDTIGISKSVEIVDTDGFELVAGLHTIAVRFSEGIFAPRFAGYLQHCPDFNSHLRKLAAGTKVYATNRRHVSSAEVRIPQINEQSAIATVLSDMDTEIESLESKLAKAREVKQGMMQELLTGRIRLV